MQVGSQFRQEKKAVMSTVHFHYFDLYGGGHLTVATGHGMGKLFSGMSLCSPKDKFSKRKGRLHAIRRLHDTLDMYIRDLGELSPEEELKQKLLIPDFDPEKIHSKEYFVEKIHNLLSEFKLSNLTLPSWLQKLGRKEACLGTLLDIAYPRSKKAYKPHDFPVIEEEAKELDVSEEKKPHCSACYTESCIL